MTKSVRDMINAARQTVADAGADFTAAGSPDDLLKVMAKSKELFAELRAKEFLQDYTIMNGQRSLHLIFVTADDVNVRVKIGKTKAGNPFVEYSNYHKEGNRALSREHDAHIGVIVGKSELGSGRYVKGVGGTKVEIKTEDDAEKALQDMARYIVSLPERWQPTKAITCYVKSGIEHIIK